MKVTITAPSSLAEIHLSKYQKYERIEEPTEKDIIKTFLNLSGDMVDKIPFQEVNRVAGIITTLFKNEPSFKRTFYINGVQYGFIPKLDAISFGEYNDIIKYTSADYQNMHRAMAVMYRPVIKERKGTYLIEDYEGSDKYADVMKKAPLDVVFGAMVFFLDLANELLNHIPNYLQQQLRKDKKLANHSLKNGEYIIKLLHSLKDSTNQLTRWRKNLYTLA